MFTIDNTVFVLIDVQGKLAQAMYGKEELFKNLSILIRGMHILDIPIVWLEQVPERLGPTIPELKELLDRETPISKCSFSCCGADAFGPQLEQTGRKQVLIAGIETHVCVYQTAADLLAGGYAVEVVADAVSSRTLANKLAGLNRAQSCGAGTSSTEMILMELLRSADHPRFREILKLIV